MNIHGPFAAGTLFSQDLTHQFDAMVTMYHEQGLMSVKTVYFKQVVNLTIGLTLIRNTQAYGTAF